MSEQEMKRAEATNEDFARDVLAYSAGYEAGKSDAQPALLLSEEERKRLENHQVKIREHRYWLSEHKDLDDREPYYMRVIEQLASFDRDITALLARSAPADSVVVRREVLQQCLGALKLYVGNRKFREECDCEYCQIQYGKEKTAIAEAEAALKGAE